MSVSIAITKIKEDEFIFRNEDLNSIDEQKLSIGFNVGFDWKFENESFLVKLIIHYKYQFEDSEIELVKFSTTTGFQVKGLNEILKTDEYENFQLDDFFMVTFVSTAVSSGRGMLANKLAGTYLADYYLPLVDPKDFLNQMENQLPQSKIKNNHKKGITSKNLKSEI